MCPRPRRLPRHRNVHRSGWRALAAAWALMGLCSAAQVAWAATPALQWPISPDQRGRAQQVAQRGVLLSELAENAPEAHTVQRGDTLWDISKLFLKSPWRWPDLWGMNLEQIRNPHLIYPGQRLVLVKADGRATLRLADGAGGGTLKLSPRVRSQVLQNGAIASIPLHLIGPFLNEAVVLGTDEMVNAPRVVATQEGRVMVSKGEVAYIRGDRQGQRVLQVFRQARPLSDPSTNEVLGFEAAYVGAAELTREGREPRGQDSPSASSLPTGAALTVPASAGLTVPASAALTVPASVIITDVRQEVGVGDRLAVLAPRDFNAYVPHAPTQAVAGQIISIYGEALTAGQNQIVSINRGLRDGIERGHVLGLWRDGPNRIDSTDEQRTAIKLPDERVGMLFVFRVFDRVSYALILRATDPVRRGDRVTEP